MAPKYQTTCRVCGGPRVPNREAVALCAEHLTEYRRDRSARSRETAPTADSEYRRVHEYQRLAISLGADESESWWCAMAAEVAFNQAGAHVFRPSKFIAAELAYLRANAGTFAALDQRKWQPVKERETVTIDDGWNADEEVA